MLPSLAAHEAKAMLCADRVKGRSEEVAVSSATSFATSTLKRPSLKTWLWQLTGEKQNLMHSSVLALGV